MKIVVRLLPSDRWHEFETSSSSTLAQLKVLVLLHWGILPSLSSCFSSVHQCTGSPTSSYSGTGTTAVRQAADHHLSGSSTTAVTSSGHSHDGSEGHAIGGNLPHITSDPGLLHTPSSSLATETIQLCAKFLAQYSFQSVCGGCFLPDEALLSARCVEYDLLVIQRRDQNACIPYDRVTQPYLSLHCYIQFVKSGHHAHSSTEAAAAAADQLNKLSQLPYSPTSTYDERTTAAARPTTASSSFSASARSVSHSFMSPDNHHHGFKLVKVQVFGETIWIHRSSVKGETQGDHHSESIKTFTLPALSSSLIESSKDGEITLMLAFLTGDRIQLKAQSEEDGRDLLRCLGPEGTTSGQGRGKQQMEWREEVYRRAIRSNLGLLQPSIPKIMSPRQSIDTTVHSETAAAIRKSNDDVERLADITIATTAARTSPVVPPTLLRSSTSLALSHLVKAPASSKSTRVTDTSVPVQQAPRQTNLSSQQHDSTIKKLHKFNMMVARSQSALPPDLRILPRPKVRRTRSFSTHESPPDSCHSRRQSSDFKTGFTNTRKDPQIALLPAFQADHKSPVADIVIVSSNGHTGDEIYPVDIDTKKPASLDSTSSIDSRPASADPRSSNFSSPTSSEYSSPGPRYALHRLVPRDDRRTASEGRPIARRFFTDDN